MLAEPGLRASPGTASLTSGRQMKKIALLLVAAVLMCALPCPAAAADAFDDFSSDPRISGNWDLSWGWVWSSQSQRVTAWPFKTDLARWTGGSFDQGTLGVGIRFLASGRPRPARAGLIYGWQTDTATPAYRFVTLVAGEPGMVIIGRRGGPDAPWSSRVDARAQANILLQRWYRLQVYFDVDGSVYVYLSDGGQPPVPVLSYREDGGPPSLGAIGFRSIQSQTQFDDFSFSSTEFPDYQPCELCHSGHPPAGYSLAPNVMQYWDGSWWDFYMGGSATVQQGGHGDPDGFPATDCTGANGCHDMTQSAATHRDGILHVTTGGHTLRTGNTYHLRTGFINPAPVNTWDVQVTFDNYCYTACHQGYGVVNHRHGKNPTPNVVMFGLGHTTSDADSGSPRPVTYPVDSDLTTLASRTNPDYAPCISCHDPHGTGVQDHSGSAATHSNRMLRDNFTYTSDDALCVSCHK